MIGIIDYNLCNINSIYNAVEKLTDNVKILKDGSELKGVDKIILPGVGSFPAAVRNLKKQKLFDHLKIETLDKRKPILGICLGMQLLFEESFEFEKTKGLEFINGKVVKFNKKDIITTHLGWNKFEIQKNNFKNDFKKFENKYFYFIHSYYVQPKQKQNIFGTTPYGKMNFCSMTKKGNIFGTQFHPEKSGYWGIEFLKNLKKLI